MTAQDPIATVRDLLRGPRRTYREIAQVTGLSQSKICQIAKEMGLRRGQGGAGSRASPRGRKPLHRDRVIDLISSGLHPIEIAQELGLTRQGVESVLLSHLRDLVLRFARERGVSPVRVKARSILAGSALFRFEPSQLRIHMCHEKTWYIVPIYELDVYMHALAGRKP